MTPITKPQHQVLAWVKRFVATNGYPPTRSEIAAGLGFKSPNAAQEHLEALQRKGELRLVTGIARGIVIEKTAGVRA